MIIIKTLNIIYIIIVMHNCKKIELCYTFINTLKIVFIPLVNDIKFQNEKWMPEESCFLN